jgi:hypothetical protein
MSKSAKSGNMNDGPKTYHLEDELNRGYPDKPILKEEQKKILERLLEVDQQRLSPDELEMMQKLVHRLDEDSQRIKDMRRKVEGKGTLDSVLAALQKDPDLARYTPVPVQPPEPPAPKPKERPASKPLLEKPSKPALSATETAAVESSKPKMEPPADMRTPRPRAAGRRTTPPPPRKSAKAKPSAPTPETPPGDSLREEPSVAPEGTDVILEMAAPEKAKSDPVEVVRRYILAWNHKAFAPNMSVFPLADENVEAGLRGSPDGGVPELQSRRGFYSKSGNGPQDPHRRQPRGGGLPAHRAGVS